MEALLQDIRFGLRSLRRAPGFTLAVVLVMGLGVGVNTMVFGIAYGLLQRDLPFVREEGLLRLEMARPSHGVKDMELSALDYRAVGERAKTLDGVGAYYDSQAYITLGDEPERFDMSAITPGFFKLLGVAPAMGREFTPDEGVYNQNWTSVIISERIWEKRLGRDPAILGRVFNINGRARQVVGVMPMGFHYDEDADFWIPLSWDPAEESWEEHFLQAYSRLAPGVTLDQARAELATLMATLTKEHPDERKGMELTATPYREAMGREIRPMMILLLCAVGFVMLIACANVANLMLARAAGRHREISLRMAIGASRWRIARQLMTEGVLVALMGGALGLLFATWGRDIVLGAIPFPMPYWMDFSTDFTTLGYLIGVSALAGILASLAPAFQVSDLKLVDALKEGGAQSTVGHGRLRLRRGLVVAEVALSLVLLAGAGLMVRSFFRMADEQGKIDPTGVITGRVTLVVAVYKEDADKREFFRELLPAVGALPGVKAVAAVNQLPVSNNSWTTSVMTEAAAGRKDAELPHTFHGIPTPGYFKTMGIRLLQGRDFTDADDHTAPRVAIVNESAARMLWPGQEPLGKRFRFGPRDTAGWRTVVGVVEDVHQNPSSQISSSEGLSAAQVFEPHAQNPVQTMTLVARTDGDPVALTTPIRRLLQARDSNLPFYDAMPLAQAFDLGVWEYRLFSGMMGAFAVIALLIAAVGLYGVMAYSVAQRTQEIGIRMALGAVATDVQRMVVVQALRLTMLGIGIGLAGAYVVTRAMATLLFDVKPGDPPTFIGVTMILALSGVLAAWLPARRATRVDPLVALRYE